jgi:hypothetical protein
VSDGELSLDAVKAELKGLRQGAALSYPASVLRLSPELRRHLASGKADSGSAEEIVEIVHALRMAVAALADHERSYAAVDLNLAAEHSHATLTERQESLAASMRRASKTIRRRADRALDTVALHLLSGQASAVARPRTDGAESEYGGVERAQVAPISQIGGEFSLRVPTVEYGNPSRRLYTLPNPEPGRLLDLTWSTFGAGIERLVQQIKHLGRGIDVDICFGINEAGLVMATFLSSAQFRRCSIGYLKCNKVRDAITLDAGSHFPSAGASPTIVICDFEVKHADVIGHIVREVRARYDSPELYFAVFGAMVKGDDLEIQSFDELTGGGIMSAAKFEAVFIAATMSHPGIEPPLELR